jgi:hypothetical protein
MWIKLHRSTWRAHRPSADGAENRACDRRWVMTEMMKWRLARGSISVQAQLCIDVA